MSSITIPSAIEALLDGPIDEQVLATLRTHYEHPLVPGAAIDELLAIVERVGNRGSPAFKEFINGKLSDLLVQDFDPLRRG